MRWKNYSIFISSTFADMHSERDYLRTHIFPAINQELKKYSISLRVIDLRCGVNTSDESNEKVEEKVMRVCFDEIDRSRPFFIGLLGNRYGWIPPACSEQHWLKRGIKERGSITSMEIEYGFLMQEEPIGCLFMERDASCLESMPEDLLKLYDDKYSTDLTTRSSNPKKLEDLKSSIKKHLAETGRTECYKTYCPTWNGTGFENLEDFGEKVKTAIINDIRNLFAFSQDDSAFALEQEIQDNYIRTKLSYTKPRENIVNALTQKIKEKQGLLAISGESGSGKSCIYAQLAYNFQQLPDEYIVLVHSTAAGRDCHEFHQMLQRWNYQLEDIFHKEHKETVSAKEAIVYFSNLIKQTPKGKKLLMFVDAIDGFNRNTVTEYLTFYPRSLSERWLMVCTSLPERLENVSQHHRSMEKYTLPALTEEEAKDIIEHFTKFNYTELYSENIKRLLGKNNNGESCYGSPLWLIIALSRIVNLDQNDFAEISQSSKDFNIGTTKHINNLIDGFHYQESELFRTYLQHLDRAYDNMPSDIFKLLSISYNGLNEGTMAELLEDKWSALNFATIRSFLCDFLAEQSGSKTWKIMHDKCRLELADHNIVEYSAELAEYYIQQLKKGEHVDDNICYYLIQIKNHSLINYHYRLTDDYFNMLYLHKERITQELIQICDIVDNNLLMQFLFEAFTQRRGNRKFIPKALIFWQLKSIVAAIVDNLNQHGKYESTVRIMEAFFQFIEEQEFNSDIKTVMYIIMEAKRDDAAYDILSEEEYRQLILDATKRAKVKGLLSLLIAPIARKYYKWKIYKLD